MSVLFIFAKIFIKLFNGRAEFIKIELLLQLHFFRTA